MPTSARTSGPPASSGRVWAPAPTGFKCRKTARRRRNPGSRGGPCGRPRAGTSPAPTEHFGRAVPAAANLCRGRRPRRPAPPGHRSAPGGCGHPPLQASSAARQPAGDGTPEVGAALVAARGRGQAPPLRSILAGRCLPQQTSVGADAHVGPPLRATGQLRAGVGTRPYRLQVPQDSPPETEPRKGRAALVAAHSRGRGSAIQIEEAGGSVL